MLVWFCLRRYEGLFTACAAAVFLKFVQFVAQMFLKESITAETFILNDSTFSIGLSRFLAEYLVQRFLCQIADRCFCLEAARVGLNCLTIA